MSRHELPAAPPSPSSPPSPVHPDPGRQEQDWETDWDEDLLVDELSRWPASVPDDVWAGEAIVDWAIPLEEWAPWSPVDAPDDEIAPVAYFDEPVHGEAPPPTALPGPVSEWDEAPGSPSAELPILGLHAMVHVDGRRLIAQVDVNAPRTRWAGPGLPRDVTAVPMVVDSVSVVAQVERSPAEREVIVLGRDVLSGRFLIRP